MQQFKRVAAMLLCLVMLFTCLPVGALAADTTGEVVDAAIIFSDLHTSSSDYKQSTVTGIMTALKNTGLPFSSVTSAGDAFSVNADNTKYTGKTSTITGCIQSVLGNVPVNYVWSDHDRYAMQADDKTLLSNDSGLVYGAGADGQYGTDDDANYYIYSLSMADLSTNNRYYADFHTDAEVAQAIADFTEAAASLKQDRHLFIASHQPLLDRRNDNGHAYEWATAINAVAENMDVAFFFGHNHSHDVAKDYYYAKGETMSVCSDSSGNARDVVLNFTHMSAGYMDPASTGSTSNTTRQGVAVAITIYEDAINYTTYNASGVYTGNYALNETVTRAHAKTSTEVVEKKDEATGITVSAAGITGVTVTKNENPAYDAKVYGAYASYNIEVAGHVDGVEATVTLPAPDGFDADKPVLVLYDGAVIATTAITDGKISFTTDHFSTYDVAQVAAEKLNWVEIPVSSGEAYYELATSIESGATYLIGNKDSGTSIRLMTNSGGKSDYPAYSDGKITGGVSADSEWVLTASGSGYTFKDSNGEYMYPNYSYNSARITTGASSGQAVTVSFSGSAASIRRTVSSRTIYLRYSNSAFGASTSSGDLYLFKKVAVSADPVWAAMEGQTSFRLQVGSYNENTIRNAISVYTATDAEGTGKAPVTDYQLVGTVNGGTAGTYELSVQYGGKELGKVTVVMASDPYLKITENGEEKELIFKKNVKTGDTVQLGVAAFNGTATVANPGVTWEIPEEYAGMATVDSTGRVTFLVDRANFMVKASWTVEGDNLTDTIQIIITPDNYLTPGTSTNDFPEYPNEGAIRYDKTAEAVGNFSETGVAQLELSMTGIPFSAPKTLDVVVMLDRSSSMYKSGVQHRIPSTIAATKVFVENIVKNADGSFNNNRVIVMDFLGGNLDSSQGGGTSHKYQSNLYTLDESSGYEIISSQDELDALFDRIDSGFKGQTSLYGTEYAQGLEDCYNALANSRAEGNQQFCVFMSDGIPNYMKCETTHFKKTSDIVKMFTVTNSSSSSAKATRGSAYEYEYYSTQMKNEGVTVFTVGLGLYNTNSAWSGASKEACEQVANMLLNDISGPAGETAADRDTGNTVSKKDKYFFSVADANAAEDMKNVFTNIASQIMMAATDIVVTDKVTEEYTMIFGIPQSAGNDADAEKRNEAVQNALADQPLYIEVVNYTLDEKHERTTTVDTLTRIYLKDSNGTAAGGTYSAATDANGTAAPAPTFTAKTEGKRGYWSVFNGTAGADDIVITVNGTTWKFMERGDGTHNMTAGAYAFGNIDAKTNMSEDLVIVTPYFAYSAKTRMLAWTADKVEEFKELALRYFLYLNDSSTEIGTAAETDPGTYPTNEWAYITYTNHLGNDCRREFPIPQMTWNGAQVSYVFYLVNEQGEPINKAGERVDFANATFITDVFTEYVVWNDTDTPTEEGHAYLDARWMAEDKLPEGYTLYDGEAYYELKVYEDHEGNVLDNYFMIDGGEATGNTESTTKVYNTKAGAKYSAYGTYRKDNVVSGFDFANTTVAFAVVWKLQLNPDTVVVDYGLDVLVNVVENDLMSNTLTGISKTERSNLTMNTGIAGNPGFTSQTLDYTDYVFSVEGENQIRFHQKNMQFDEPVKMYYETKSTDYINGTPRTGYMYSSLTVIPATTIYYEDSFVSYAVTGSAKWETVGTAGNDVQDQDRPGASQISKDLDADNNYGYDSAYENMSQYSMGSAKKVTVSSGNAGRASFSFYGTGFDVISMTDNMTGTIIVKVYSGSDATGTLEKSLTVDTYYGYAYDSATKTWYTVDSNSPNALYQVPVMKVSGLDYGQHYVTITATYQSLFDHNTVTGEDGTTSKLGKYDFYLDAIRIYDPTGNRNDVANNAYVKDGEGWPIYKKLRSLILDKGSFGSDVTVESDAGSATTKVSGIVFIDCANASGAGNTVSIVDYNNYGPNNELYLAPGQAIAFEISDAFVKTGTTTAIKPVDVQLAIKTVGGSANIEIFNPGVSVTTEGGTTTTKATKDNLIAEGLNSATDMYYSIGELADGTIVIANSGTSGILSITNIKFTFDESAAVRVQTTVNEENGESSVASISEAGAVFALRSLSAYSVTETVEVETEATEPETTEPETEATEPETTEPEETEPETTVPEETEPETEPENDIIDIGIGKVIRIIKKLIGFIFG